MIPQLKRLQRRPGRLITLCLILIGGGLLLPYFKSTLLARSNRPPLSRLYETRGMVYFTDLTPLFPEECERIRRYTIEINARIEGLFFEIYIASRHSLLIDARNPHRNGIYRYDDSATPRLIHPLPGSFRSGDSIQAALDCDLEKNLVRLRMPGIPEQTCPLDSGEICICNATVKKFQNTSLEIRRLDIRDDAGKPIFHFDLHPRDPRSLFLFHAPELARACMIAGCLLLVVLIPLLPAAGRVLAVAALLGSVELFLRLTESGNPYLDIRALMSQQQWDYENLTDLFDNHRGKDTIKLGNALRGSDRTEFPLHPPAGTLKIVCMGSSAVEGGDIRRSEDVFSWALEAAIRKQANKPCLVVNAGFTDLDAPSAMTAIHFRDVLAPFAPDLLIFYSEYPPTDYSGMYLRYEALQTLVRSHPGSIRSNRRLMAALTFRHPTGLAIRTYDLLCDSFLFMGLERLRQTFSPPPPPAPVADTDAQAPARFWAETAARMPELFRTPESRVPPPDFMQATLRLARLENPNCRVLLIPLAFFPPPQPDSDKGVREQYTRRQMPLLKQMFDYVDYLNLDGELRGGGPDEVHFANEGHPNESGHRIIANAIYRWMRQNSLI